MIYLAIQQLLARKKQTIFIMLGIFIGIMGYVIISSMIIGVQRFLIDQVIQNDAHIRIKARDELIDSKEITSRLFSEEEVVRWLKPPKGQRGSQNISYPHGWFEKLENNPNVVVFMANLSVQVIIRRNNKGIACVLVGTNPFKHTRITSIQENMQIGNFTDIGTAGNRIILGDGILKKLGADVNDIVMISVARGEPEPFRIVGTFHIGIPQMDESIGYAPLSAVQKINGSSGQITDIAVKLTDPELSTSLASEWNFLGKDHVETWQEKNEQFLSAFKVQDFMRFMVSGSILLVAGFGIYNILSIVINQKKREIAILRSLGYDSKDILELFMVQGIIMGIGGGVLGLLFGFLLTFYLSSIQIYPENLVKKGKIPFAFDLSIYITGFFLAIFSSALASLIPSYKAAKLTPIEIIRSEM